MLKGVRTTEITKVFRRAIIIITLLVVNAFAYLFYKLYTQYLLAQELYLQSTDTSINLLASNLETIFTHGIILFLIFISVSLAIFFFIFKPMLLRLKSKHDDAKGLTSKLYGRIEEKKEHVQKMLEIINQYVYTSHTDKKGVITYVSDAFCEISGYAKEELIGKTHRVIKHPDNPGTLFTPMWKSLLAGKEYRGLVKNRHKDGSTYWFESYIVPDYNESGDLIGFQAFRQDVTDKVNLETLNNELEKRVHERTKEIEQMAVTDQLTGLYNRHRFDKELEDALHHFNRYRMPTSLALIDIDFFKKINDTYGHAVGDEVLIRFADILRKNIRITDVIARWGGEEFVILLSATNLERALVVMENLLEIVRTFPFDTVGRVTFSAGLVAFHESDDEKSLLSRADELLYKAKHSGRDQVCM